MFATAVTDTFYFKQGDGHDIVIGFDPILDHIDVADSGGQSGLTAEAFLDMLHVTAEGVLFVDGADSILFQDVLLASLTVNNVHGTGIV
jgi:hypothetical protein